MNASLTPVQARPSRRFGFRRVFLFLVLAVAILFYLMPMYVMVVSGLKDAADVSIDQMWNLPTSFTAGGFAEAWRQLSPNLAQSFLLVIPATIISSLIGAINGYLFSKWRFRGSEVLFALVLFGMFIPYQSILIPLIQFLDRIGLYGSLPGLIVVHVIYGIPITTLIFRNYFANIPYEIVEAARIDGAGLWQIFRQVMLPLSLPAFVVVGIFQFTNIWNEFLFGLTVITNPRQQPVTVALNNLSGSFSVSWNVVMAGAVIAALPTLVIYVLLGRFFIQGMLAGSMKG
ncbi:MAG TPA: carbohydrate ABC transporter permease [Thermomicrobiales bacterium]|nr:carbohydrate ABC transporter permease [Thermomicrobiales bacterium]